MKILFTGSSSFTGYWFIKFLVEAGHEVTAVFPREKIQYEGLRKDRMEQVQKIANAVFNCSFGDDRFLQLIRSASSWDVLCHHGAWVTNYKSQDFDIGRAVENNTHRLADVLKLLVEKNCRKIVITGSVFEPDEGTGTEPLRAFSPYALSKKMTADMFRYFCDHFALSLGKFVISNPFGPFEEERFTHYLITSWLSGQTPVVRTPEYVRDNIPVSLLSLAYQDFVEQLSAQGGFFKTNPSGYRESQKDFTRRVRANLEKHLSVPCPVEFATQTDFLEPLNRVNTDTVMTRFPQWREAEAWQELAAYYIEKRPRV